MSVTIENICETILNHKYNAPNKKSTPYWLLLNKLYHKFHFHSFTICPNISLRQYFAYKHVCACPSLTRIASDHRRPWCHVKMSVLYIVPRQSDFVRRADMYALMGRKLYVFLERVQVLRRSCQRLARRSPQAPDSHK